ncbi:MAG TPA: FHA domain-containing protein [Vicinamibacterales bacterium]|nr:FHA domain-containing protein [Vicinamibacterales bacterium]
MAGWILTSGDEPPVVMRLTPGTMKTVGRTSRADFILDATLVSRVHCRLSAEPSDQLVVEDLDSTNGTHVNGVRVDRAVLRTGDVVRIGRVDFRVAQAE